MYHIFIGPFRNSNGVSRFVSAMSKCAVDFGETATIPLSASGSGVNDDVTTASHLTWTLRSLAIPVSRCRAAPITRLLFLFFFTSFSKPSGPPVLAAVTVHGCWAAAGSGAGGKDRQTKSPPRCTNQSPKLRLRCSLFLGAPLRRPKVGRWTLPFPGGAGVHAPTGQPELM